MTTILEAVAARATVLDATLVAGSVLFAGRLPATPDRAVAVFAYEGQTARYTMQSGATVELPRIQVLCRNVRDRFDLAEADARVLHDGLDVYDTTWDGNTILRCHPLGVPAGVGVDESERPLVRVNFELQVLA